MPGLSAGPNYPNPEGRQRRGEGQPNSKIGAAIGEYSSCWGIRKGDSRLKFYSLPLS
jgi:hypothetical protein